MSKNETYESCPEEDAMQEALDKLIEKAKSENSALKKILEGMDIIQKRELKKNQIKNRIIKLNQIIKLKLINNEKIC
jgi:hypothetical protein